MVVKKGLAYRSRLCLICKKRERGKGEDHAAGKEWGFHGNDPSLGIEFGEDFCPSIGHEANLDSRGMRPLQAGPRPKLVGQAALESRFQVFRLALLRSAADPNSSQLHLRLPYFGLWIAWKLVVTSSTQNASLGSRWSSSAFHRRSA